MNKKWQAIQETIILIVIFFSIIIWCYRLYKKNDYINTQWIQSYSEQIINKWVRVNYLDTRCLKFTR